jgi:hypothetical protein
VNEEEQQQKSRTFVRQIGKAASDKYETIESLIQGNLNECNVTQLKCCVKERQYKYNKKHCCHISFYPVDNSRILASSAICNSVCKPYTNLPDTPVALNSRSKYFQMLPAPPGALERALRLWKSILTCTRKHLERWRYIQNATRLTISIVKS